MIILSTLYVVFMFTVDVPMYIEQYRHDQDSGVAYWSLSSGLKRMARCQEVSDDWALWKNDSAWMTGYFGLAPAACLALVRVATHQKIVGGERKLSQGTV